MRIAVNTRFLIPGKLEGIGRFTYEIFRRVTANHPEHEFLFYFDRAFSEDFVFQENVIPHKLFPPARHPYLWYWYFEQAVPMALQKHKADAFLSTDGYLSLKARVPSSTVLHDLNFEESPENLPWLTRKYYQYYFPLFAKRSDRLQTVSEFSKKDIVQRYGIDPDLIDVVYNGAHERFQPMTENEITAYRNNSTEGAPYFVFVGALNPRKNVARLLHAFDALKKSSDLPHKLLIVGEKMFLTGSIQEAFQSMEHSKSVIFTGRLDNEPLRRVVAAAESLILPSTYEGFGIPLVEAMQCGVPVLAADATALPEVTGDAGLLFDPLEINSIVGAMKRMAENNDLRSDLIAKCLLRAKEFSWDRSAEVYWSSVEKMMKDAGSLSV
jgi:glycosyltransferase involved in cell wall biosynthesis